MKRFIYLLLTACLLAGASTLRAQEDAGPGNVFSLQRAVTYAMDNSNTIRNARVDILDAEQNVKERLSAGLPQFNGTVDFTHYFAVPVIFLPENFPGGGGEASLQLKNNFVAGLNARAMLFDGSFFVALRAARASGEYFNLELENAQRRVRSQVTQTYFPVLLIKTNIEVLNRNITNLEKLLAETRAQFEAGFVEKLDVDRLRLSVSNLTSQRDQLFDQGENALRALKFTLNYPLDESLVVEDDLEKIDLEIQDAMLTGAIPYLNRPEVRLLDKTLELQDLNIKLQKAAYLPTVYATVAGQQQYQGNDFKNGFWAPTVLAGLSVGVPIYDFGARSARVQRAVLAKEKIVNQRNDVNRTIQLEVLNARTTFTAANKRYQTTKDNLDLANDIYEVTQIKYSEGVGSSIEVVQAEQQLYETQANYLQALYDALVAKEDLYLALGR
ncbi:TolC family protein [Neolewinella antarctica]|uniref:Outer membrane protein TolC n=1 Tax=Neolewinella antarctica TaxID=442734 RepID=A0ABX0XA79_9BACT|nr:TolC family protein [Neolewinella antarctica]NJC25728.1 outer membrane protein TolC [Neolewinella antarctica]